MLVEQVPLLLEFSMKNGQVVQRKHGKEEVEVVADFVVSGGVRTSVLQDVHTRVTRLCVLRGAGVLRVLKSSCSGGSIGGVMVLEEE